MQRARELQGPHRVLHVHHTPRGPEHVDVELRPILGPGREVLAFVERLATVRHASPRASRAGLVGHAPTFSAALAGVHPVAPSSLPVPRSSTRGCSMPCKRSEANSTNTSVSARGMSTAGDT